MSEPSAACEPAHDLAPAFGPEIGDDRAFAPVAGMEIGGGGLAAGIDEGRSPGSGLVAFRALDLDHVGAEISERLPDRGAREHPRELDHPDPGKRGVQKNACRPVCARPRISA